MSLFMLGGAQAQGLLLGGSGTQGLIPLDFFNAPLDPSAPTHIEAVTLSFDTDTGDVVATGDVIVKASGYTARGDHLLYNRGTGDLSFVGPATVIDPSGNVLNGVDLEVTGELKTAFIDSLTITSYDGSQITADSLEYDEAVRTILNQATYAPCGDCIDEKGRRIGWSIRATRFIQNGDDQSIEMEQPILEILGIPVAWLPYLWLPDLKGTVLDSVEMPTYSYSEKLGHSVTVPFRAYSSAFTDIILTPKLMTRQGGLLAAEWIQRFEGGTFRVKGSGVYQLDPSAFEGDVGERDWRGAIQTSGSFRPVSEWLVGWSYTAFTDMDYLKNYDLATGDDVVSEIYATHLSQDTYFDIRFQRFNRLGTETREGTAEGIQAQQGHAIPNVRFDNVTQLGNGLGQLELTGRLLGVHRDGDMWTRRRNDDGVLVPYVQGFEGRKYHAMAQVGWQNQWIMPGGVAFTPYLGLRADAASYDGASGNTLAPDATSLFSATPIAAMDIRWPWALNDGANVHIVEPIAQLVYRGGESFPGITNDNAQSFVFDDTNLFSYNRFSGTDRQETGLRANVGGRYMANFLDGSYLELIGGQSFHLAGTNAFTLNDPALTGQTEPMEADASYAVLGAYAGINPWLTVGGKLQVDSDDLDITRAGLGAALNFEGYSAGLDYFYLAGNPEVGVPEDQHEIGATLGVPLIDYWRATAGAYWDITNNSWLQVNGGLQYDDGYLQIGAGATVTGPTHTSPDETRFTATFLLKAPAGLNVGYSGGVGF